MKNIVIKKCVLIIMSIVLLLSGCSSGKEPGVTDFNGTYYVDEYTAYRFDGTGEGALCLGEETEYIFHYAVAKDILFIDFEDEGASDVKYTYILKGKELSVTEQSTGSSYVMKKK